MRYLIYCWHYYIQKTYGIVCSPTFTMEPYILTIIWLKIASDPDALGRKNYLFAGSHEGAQRIAMFYSFLGTCKLNVDKPLQLVPPILA